ncbi:MAG: N-acetylmuramoyl-L-alanine amidase, partial [Bacteroides sp.]|nr:N-acetylmuramoyl-L-alanine amidase [Bacteroides sp.]
HAFLARHNRKGSTYYREFLELNRGKLGRNNSLKLGVSYKLPPLKGSSTTQSKPSGSSSNAKPVVGKTLYEPLFGPKLAYVEIKSDALKDACFYIVSGHGGPDPGAIGKVGNIELHEDEYAYDIALRLARNLMMQGAKVHIIIQDAKDGIRDDRYLSNSKRETCMRAAIPLNQVQRLKQRSEKINQLYQKDKQNYKYCRSIFIHIDSRSKRQQTDVFFYHSGSAGSSRLANMMRSTFERKYRQHQPNRGFSGTVSQRNLYVLKNTVPVGVYVELGNIQNEFDQKRIVMNSNRQALANWLCEGFMTDYKSR